MKQPTRARTYQIPIDLIARVDALSQEMEIFPSNLIALLIARSLDEIERGEWRLTRRAIKFVPVWNDDEKSSQHKG